MLIRYGVWKYVDKKKRKTHSLNDKLVVEGIDWDNDDDHAKVRAMIREKHPGYIIHGYCLDKNEMKYEVVRVSCMFENVDELKRYLYDEMKVTGCTEIYNDGFRACYLGQIKLDYFIACSTEGDLYFQRYDGEAEVDKFQTDLERNIKFGLDDEIISELAYGELMRKIKRGYGFYLFERSEL